MSTVYAEDIPQQYFDEEPSIAIIGDSLFAFPLSRRIGLYLDDIYDRPINDYAINGAVLLDDNGRNVISNQYFSKVRIDLADVDTVIMDGGGNDAFANESECIENLCPGLLEDMIEELNQFLDTLLEDGVRNVIYVGYYHPTGSKVPLIPFLDIATDRMKQACSNAEINCTFIDTRETFRLYGESQRLISFDGLHTSSRGSSVIAEMILEELNKIDMQKDLLLH
tara:strand:- start:1372 stop:2043 length:672 start_codon:yes stop_codon:yes gene_type:complete